MESYDEFKKRLVKENPKYSRSSDAFLQKKYLEKTGISPADSSTYKSAVRGLEPINTHQSLDRIGGFILIAGWLSLSIGVFILLIQLISGGSVVLSVSTMLIGLMLIANGQFLRVTGEIEQNTQKTALLLERVAAKLLADTDKENSN